jgi:hypothetical protein
MTTETIIQFGEIVGPWHTTPGRGCTENRRERLIQSVTIFEADYYGNGPSLYAKGHKRIEADGAQRGPRFGSWSDGNPERVAAWQARLAAGGA